MAEQFARIWIEKNNMQGVDVFSAGITALEFERASQGAEQAMRARSASLESHRARQLSDHMMKEADLILTMTDGHKRMIAPFVTADKLFTLCEFAGQAGNVLDPFGGDYDEYDACASSLELLVVRAMVHACG